MNEQTTAQKVRARLSEINNYESKEAFYRDIAKDLGTAAGYVKKIYLHSSNNGISDAANELGVNINNLKHGWKKNKTDSAFYTNPFYSPDNIEEISERFEDILQRYQTKIFRKLPVIEKKSELACMVTITDDHVGMNPNPNNKGLFQYEYNAKIYREGYAKVWEKIVEKFKLYGKFDLLLLDNLGDEQDGWNGETVRGGHSLDQNMTNIEVADVCMTTKIELITSCIDAGIADKVMVRKVSNDNHSGDFGAVVNLGVKKVIDSLYNSNVVDIETLQRFIEIRYWGDHCFLLTHGKDDGVMSRGLPYELNDKTVNFIDQIIDHNRISSKYVHVVKGDLHRRGYSEAARFDYTNYLSFAPPSNWVQHNFGNSKSGFDVSVIHKHDSEIQTSKITFDYKKK